ncbi:MAG: AarF/ABC1/UbiB kinase family protein [Deltaproteobacteria bacterium]|nr:AarF/ABC1/UbiB kinase family protein [Deltaproteobacteria bacterium]
MILQNLYNELPTVVSLGFNGLKRIRQTATALARTGADWILDGQPSTPVLMRRAFERLGATYIKLGQLIASSPSLFPEAYVKEFQRCLDQTEPVPFKEMKKILEKELGKGYVSGIFTDIQPEPLASASIAQVYAAKLTTGEDVVIKIQRPGVQDILKTDLNFLFYAATVLEYLVPGLKYASLAGILSEIRRTVIEECNFIKEAENIKIFSAFLKQTGSRIVITPRVYPHASSRRVLTMERLYGVPLTDRKQLFQVTDQPHRLLSAAFQTWLESISKCPIFHADLHAGNLLILNNGKVGFIDFGIVGSISDQTQEGITLLIQSLIINDHRNMAKAMAAIGMTSKKVNTGQLAKDLEELFLAPDQFIETTKFPPGPEQYLMEMVRIADVHGICFPREFTLLLKQFLYFDSYGDLLFDMEFLMEEMMEKMDDFESPFNRLD